MPRRLLAYPGSHVVPKAPLGTLTLRWDVQNTDPSTSYSAWLLLEVPLGLLVFVLGPIVVPSGSTGSLAGTFQVAPTLLPGDLPCRLTMRGSLPDFSQERVVASHLWTLRVS